MKPFAILALIAACMMAIALAVTSSQFAITGKIEGSSVPREEFFNYSVYFCAWDDCPGQFTSAIGNAKASVACALYAASDYVFGNLSGVPDAEVVMDAKAKVPIG